MACTGDGLFNYKAVGSGLSPYTMPTDRQAFDVTTGGSDFTFNLPPTSDYISVGKSGLLLIRCQTKGAGNLVINADAADDMIYGALTGSSFTINEENGRVLIGIFDGKMVVLTAHGGFLS